MIPGMGLKDLLSDVEKFVRGKGTPSTRHEFDKIDRMQREEYARARKMRKPAAPRPKTQDPRYYRRPRA